MTDGTGTFQVELGGVPRQLAAFARERTEELLREFRLTTDATPESLACRFTTMLRRLRAATDGRRSLVYAGLEDWQTGSGFHAPLSSSALSSSAPSGRTVVPPLADGVWRVTLPLGAEAEAWELARLFDEADALCAAGAVLTLPRPPELVALRWWHVTEVVRQRHGLPPTPFAG